MEPIDSVSRPGATMDRRACITDILSAESRILEFGPLDRPLVAPDEARVAFVDHAPRALLVEKYRNDPAVDVDRLPEIEHVIPDNDLTPIIDAGARFDLVVACHVFEHLPNPLLWLDQVATLLDPEGALLLVVPDRRFTFDIARRPTAPADWVEAWLERRTRPAARHVFEHFADARQVDAAALWAGRSTDWPPLPNHAPVFGLEKARISSTGTAYIDTHCSVFTPDEMIGLCRGAAELGLFRFRFDGFWPTAPGDAEFGLRLRPLPAVEPPALADATEEQARAAGLRGGFDAATLAALAAADHRFAARLRSRLLRDHLAATGLARHAFPPEADDRQTMRRTRPCP